jgi:transposase-like protein
LRKWSYEEATQVFPEVIERAVRMVSEAASEYNSQWAAIESNAAKIGCTPETLRRWIRQQERDTGQRPGPTSAEEERIKALEREVRELRKANEILRLRVRFSTRRSSTAASSREEVRRPVPPCLRCRADLQGDAGRAVGLLALRGTAAQPGVALCTHPAGRCAERRNRTGLASEPPGLRGRQGMAPTAA